jgi:uncharacterized membrane protein YozB (DUF420 family)
MRILIFSIAIYLLVGLITVLVKTVLERYEIVYTLDLKPHILLTIVLWPLFLYEIIRALIDDLIHQ